MSRRLRFSEDERSSDSQPKKKRRKQKPSEYYTGENEGARDTAPPDSEAQGDQSAKSDTKAAPAHNSHKIEKLEQKSGRYKERLGGATDALPTKKKLARKRLYDEQKNKAKTKFTFEKEVIPIGEAKWNKPKKRTAAKVISGEATRMVGNEIHSEIYQVEHENVGTKVAHRGELMGESAYRGGKRFARSAYRFHKNRPYRKVAKLEAKNLKTEAKLSYQRVLRDNPKLKGKPLARFFQKRRIKRQYAAAVRNAKQSGKVAKKSAGIVGKASKLVSNIIHRNPVTLAKLALLGLVIVMLMTMFTMCMSILSGGTMMAGAATYVADYADIDDAEIAYGEWTVDLQIYLRNIERNHPGFDEYRYDVGEINHDPFALMAYLTAVHGEFTFAEIEPILRELFAQQYRLSLTPEVEIRTRTETRIDRDGNAYTATVEYEWRVLHVTLQTRPLTMILFSRMDTDQRQHFNILMASRGARQIVGNPFDRNWLPFVSSRYGYRIHPIHGGKQFHAGIDIALPTGTEILAGFDGTVTRVGYDADGYGNFLVIDNGAGIQALYAHCHRVLVSQGQRVSEGDVIATVGSTGASTGPHLHMEVIRHGRRLNPLFFVVTGCEGGLGGIQYGDARPLTPEEFAILYAEAIRHLGIPYVYGANGPHAFDCSSFVAWVYRHSDIYPLARTTAQGIFNQSIPIPMSHISPGDIVFFTRTYSTTDTVTHLGIYLGNGQMIHAGRPVNITSIHTPFWQNHFYAVGRLRW